MKTDALRRVPARAMLAELLTNLASIVGLGAVAAVYVVSPSLWPGQWALLLVTVLIVIRVLAPFVEWWTVRYSVSSDAVHVRSGVFLSRSRTFAWRADSVLDVTAPWAFRVVGLAVVSLRTGGDDAAVTLTGVDAATLDQLKRFAHSSGATVVEEDPAHVTPADLEPAPPTTAPRASAQAHRPAAEYRASAGQLLLASLAYGQFALLGWAAVAAGAEVLDTVGITDNALLLVLTTPSLWLATAALIVGCGGVLTLVKFHNFEVRTGDRGVLTIEYGAVQRRERSISAAAILGIRVQRNPIEMALDRMRVTLLTTDSGGQAAANLVLPSLPRAIAEALVERLVTVDVPIGLYSVSGRRRLASALLRMLLVALLPAGAVVVTHLLLAPPLWVLLSIALVLGLGCAALGRLLCARLLPGLAWVRRRVFLAVEREDLVRISTLHLVQVLTQGRRRTAWVRLHLFAGRPLVLGALCRDAAIPAALTRTMIDAAPTVAATRHHYERTPA